MQYVDLMKSISEGSYERFDSIDEMCDDVSGDAFCRGSELCIAHVDKAVVSKRQHETLSQSDRSFVVVCSEAEVDDEVKECVYEFDVLERWMLADYVKTKCSGLDEDDRNVLCQVCDDDPFAIDNEATKLSSIDPAKQRSVLAELIDTGQIGTASNVTPFPLINAIVKRDASKAGSLLEEYESVMKKNDLLGFVTLLKNNFRDVVSIQMDSSATASKLGMNDKKFAALRYSTNKYRDFELVDILTRLTNVDWMIKTGRLDMKEERMMDYIVCTTMGI